VVEIACGAKAALDSGFFHTNCIACRSEPKHERRFAMTEIKWEKDFQKAVELAGKTNKPLFQDFWFDG
jgi:hypothetical protein